MREEIPFGSGSFPYREALCVLFRRNQAVTENMEYIRNEDVLVLIVDDNKNNLSIITEVLHRSGYQVMTSTDGPHALELVQERPPDVILLDFMMPGMDGFEVRDYLRKYQNCEELI